MKLNNNIQEPMCSFEVSKLLKEKGFQVLCQKSFRPSDNKEQDIIGDNLVTNGYSRPTHAVAIEWIRVNFNIWIWITVINEKYTWSLEYISKYDDRVKLTNSDFNSPQEATEAALLYVLTNLIK